MYLCNTTFSAFSSSPSDAEFDAIIGYLEDIIMGKLSKQTRWVLKKLHTHSQSTPLPAHGSSFLSFLSSHHCCSKKVYRKAFCVLFVQQQPWDVAQPVGGRSVQ